MFLKKILCYQGFLEIKIHQLELDKREMQLSSTTAQLVSQTELLSKFRDEMHEIVRDSSNGNAEKALRQVKEKLKELPCKSIDWEKFETEFKAVHPEYTKKLYDKFPNLTQTEHKMCTLLRLNLKSHEIARLFCLSERSVETHRFNIRKKLALPRESDIHGI